MSRQDQKKRDPLELLKTFKKLCPTKGSGIESVTILKRGPDGFEALVTLTEESEKRLDEIPKNNPRGKISRKDAHENTTELYSHGRISATGGDGSPEDRQHHYSG